MGNTENSFEISGWLRLRFYTAESFFCVCPDFFACACVCVCACVCICVCVRASSLVVTFEVPGGSLALYAHGCRDVFFRKP